MLGFAPAVADAVLDALCRGGSFSGPPSLFVQLHVGEPGSLGTDNVAVNDTRKPVVFTASSSGINVSNVDLKWFNVPASETYTHFSTWDAVSGGAFVFSGTMTPTSVGAGWNFSIPVGSEMSTLKVAS